jgi:hypothetical protein
VTTADLTPEEQKMVTWARKVVRDPNSTTADDVQSLREGGLSDSQIFAITTSSHYGLPSPQSTTHSVPDPTPSFSPSLRPTS